MISLSSILQKRHGLHEKQLKKIHAHKHGKKKEEKKRERKEYIAMSSCLSNKGESVS
jgi:hypothetical protein